MFGSWSPCQWAIVTGNTLVKKATGLCTLSGLLCSKSSSMVISIYDTATTDAGANATLMVDSLPVTAGNPYPIPAKFNNGIYIKLISGTGSVTVFYD